MDATEEVETNSTQRADVYTRLYDVRSYTGMYRKRFDLEVHDVTDSIVHDISTTIRTNLNRDVGDRKKRMSL